MNKFLSNFILISSALIMFASVAFYLSYQTGNFNPTNKNTPEEKLSRNVYKDSQGSPKYSSGSCRQDADCVPAGCSTQYCSNNPELITTCEFGEDFPNEEEFDCGCVEQVCVWYTQ